MEFLKTLAAASGAILIVTALIALTALWLSPGLLQRPFARWMITGKRLAPTRSNQVLMSVWAFLFGCYLLLFSLGHKVPGLIALAVWLPFGITVIKRTYWPATEA
jgi:hypothetical protein